MRKSRSCACCARYGRVSNERLISGSNLPHLRQALCTLAGASSEERLPPKAITAAADAGHAE